MKQPVVSLSQLSQKNMECNLAPLSGEGVPALHFVIATGLSSRHRAEFGTLQHPGSL